MPKLPPQKTGPSGSGDQTYADIKFLIASRRRRDARSATKKGKVTPVVETRAICCCCHSSCEHTLRGGKKLSCQTYCRWLVQKRGGEPVEVDRS